MAARYLEKLVSPVIAGLVLSTVGLVSLPTGAAPAAAPTEAGSDGPIFKQLSEVQWSKMLPELGDASPETTRATQLLIRLPKSLHVRKHWHSANETHTIITGTAAFECDGKKAEFGPGGFNYMPARRVHEAWIAAGCRDFYHRGWAMGCPLGRMPSNGRRRDTVARKFDERFLNAKKKKASQSLRGAKEWCRELL